MLNLSIYTIAILSCVCSNDVHNMYVHTREEFNTMHFVKSIRLPLICPQYANSSSLFVERPRPWARACSGPIIASQPAPLSPRHWSAQSQRPIRRQLYNVITNQQRPSCRWTKLCYALSLHVNDSLKRNFDVSSVGCESSVFKCQHLSQPLNYFRLDKY